MADLWILQDCNGEFWTYIDGVLRCAGDSAGIESGWQIDGIEGALTTLLDDYGSPALVVAHLPAQIPITAHMPKIKVSMPAQEIHTAPMIKMYCDFEHDVHVWAHGALACVCGEKRKRA